MTQWVPSDRQAISHIVSHIVPLYVSPALYSHPLHVRGRSGPSSPCPFARSPVFGAGFQIHCACSAPWVLAAAAASAGGSGSCRLRSRLPHFVCPFRNESTSTLGHSCQDVVQHCQGSVLLLLADAIKI